LYDKVILSGRRRYSKEINAANSKIVRHCHESGKPILGICYGAEIIALTMGGAIRKMPSHVQGPTTITVKETNALTLGKNSISVYESHAYCVSRLPTGFRSLAKSENCENELFAHLDKNIFGTQFHPEKSGPDGNSMLKNFVAL
jgi:GMP synthase (glutamine-hydrolysing)